MVGSVSLGLEFREIGEAVLVVAQVAAEWRFRWRRGASHDNGGSLWGACWWVANC